MLELSPQVQGNTMNTLSIGVVGASKKEDEWRVPIHPGHVTLRAGAEHQARMLIVEHDGSERPLSDLISESGIIINGVFQDTNHPIDFVIEEEKSCLNPGCLFIHLPLPPDVIAGRTMRPFAERSILIKASFKNRIFWPFKIEH